MSFHQQLRKDELSLHLPFFPSETANVPGRFYSFFNCHQESEIGFLQFCFTMHRKRFEKKLWVRFSLCCAPGGPLYECSVHGFHPLPTAAHVQHLPRPHPRMGSVERRETTSNTGWSRLSVPPAWGEGFLPPLGSRCSCRTSHLQGCTSLLTCFLEFSTSFI